MAVASVDGKLKAFVTKMIKFNEASKQMNEPAINEKAASSRSLIFNVTFLILYSIVSTYGCDVLEEGGDSFFEQWVRECLPERGKLKSPHKMLQNRVTAHLLRGDWFYDDYDELGRDLSSGNGRRQGITFRMGMRRM